MLVVSVQEEESEEEIFLFAPVCVVGSLSLTSSFVKVLRFEF